MLFDDINVDTIVHNDELYINVNQLSSHIYTAAKGFIEEAKYIEKAIGGISSQEKTYIGGIAEGMYSIVLLLTQGKAESDIHGIDTIEELIKRFEDNV